MFNEIIKKLRMEKNLTQTQFGREVGVSKQCVSNWENDYIQPSVDMLVKVANYFAVSTDYLLGLDNKKILQIDNLTDLEISHIRDLIKDLNKYKTITK